MSRIVDLPSGAKLRVAPSNFSRAKALYQAVMVEAKAIDFRAEREFDLNFRKELFCTALSSKLIEKAVWDCFDQVLYNDEKISEKTFEDPKTWDDYISVCYEVAKENILPFTKSLFAELLPLFQAVIGDQALRSETTTS